MSRCFSTRTLQLSRGTPRPLDNSVGLSEYINVNLEYACPGTLTPWVGKVVLKGTRCVIVTPRFPALVFVLCALSTLAAQATNSYGTTPSRAPALVAQQRSRKEPAHLSKPEFTAGCTFTGQAVTTHMGSFMDLQLENYNSVICRQGIDQSTD